ncbi:hypothetical protein [Rudaea cellulosilytica]|uniref:hypothetical protein n=1 Tax=Rudaea cellulosilytica TaxID=540746 RepID=UPI000376B0DF|nr:hypothetical protein [Rudaea cellulosilytica]
MHGTRRHPKLDKALAPVTRKHYKSHWPEWVIGKEMMDKAMKSIIARVHLNRSFDIPYLAGYSLDGHTIFIDRHMPRSFVYRGKRVNTDRFLVVHEAVEKSLIQLLGMHYLTSHQIALHAEQAAVRAEGVTWDAYNEFMETYIKVIGDENLSKVPDTLDLTPYVDFHDAAELKQMRANMVPGPKAQPKARVHIAGL